MQGFNRPPMAAPPGAPPMAPPPAPPGAYAPPPPMAPPPAAPGMYAPPAYAPPAAPMGAPTPYVPPAAAPGYPPPGAYAPPPQAPGYGYPPPQAPAPAAPPPLGGSGSAQDASFWHGVQSAQDKAPMLHPGTYRVRVLGCEQGFNPQTREASFKGHLEVVYAWEGATNHVGDRAAIVNKLAGQGLQRARERTKAFVVAAAGYPDDAAYARFDPEHKFLASTVGAANEYSQAGHTLVGRLVDVRVTKGNDKIDKKTGAVVDYYREYAWAVVPEDQQDRTRMPSWGQA